MFIYNTNYKYDGDKEDFCPFGWFGIHYTDKGHTLSQMAKSNLHTRYLKPVKEFGETLFSSCTNSK